MADAAADLAGMGNESADGENGLAPIKADLAGVEADLADVRNSLASLAARSAGMENSLADEAASLAGEPARWAGAAADQISDQVFRYLMPEESFATATGSFLRSEGRNDGR